MALQDWLKKRKSSNSKPPQESSFKLAWDTQGVSLTLKEFSEHEDPFELRSEIEMLQSQALDFLLEGGQGDSIEGGIYLSHEEFVQLDLQHRDLFDLPEPWPGQLKFEKRGFSYSSDVEFSIQLIKANGEPLHHFSWNGPFLEVSSEERYLPDALQYQALKAVETHSKLSKSKKTEYRNLSLVHLLMESREQGLSLSMEPFGDLKTSKPDQVGLRVDSNEDGSLELSPSFGAKFDHQLVKERLGQLNPNESDGSLRVDKDIILIDEEKFTAIQEIKKNRKIPKRLRQEFFKNPSAFLNTSIVNLDSGFSWRVRGAGPFQHAYFGQRETSGESWYEYEAGQKTPSEPLNPASLPSVIKSRADLEEFQQKLIDAQKTGAQAILFKGKTFDITNDEALRAEIEKISNTLNEDSASAEADFSQEVPKDPTVLQIETHDESIEETMSLDSAPEEGVFSKRKVDWNNLKREPYPHQEKAVRWLIYLAIENLEKWGGALLADDMGLGKTFSALVFAQELLNHLQNHPEKNQPILVVAPLILLDVWEKEIADTFKNSPFEKEKMVVLQSARDLPQYRHQGKGRETHQDLSEPEINQGIESNASEMDQQINYALDWEALEQQSLVLTTYGNLRDYQFSLARIDWSLVVFDEAQNIKNPNTIQTHAAKALKAKFKLLLTGTPVENSLADFWSLFDCLEPGHLGTYQDFRKKYIRPILNASPESQIREEIGKTLRKKAGGYMLQRSKEDELKGLPKKEIIPKFCTMPQEQQKRYDASLNTIIEGIESGEKAIQLKGLHWLRKVTLHPDLLGGSPKLPTSTQEAQACFEKSGKLNKLLEILNSIAKKGEKVIVFVTSKDLQDLLKAGLESIYRQKVNVINGDTKTTAKKNQNQTRKGFIEHFQKSNGFQILIMSPIAAGVGLTITEANNVIHLERHWNPAKEAQATDRIYRIGQKKEVNVFIPILQHPELESFDIKLHHLLENKVSLKDAIMTQDVVREDQMVDIFGKPAKNPESQRLRIEDVSRLDPYLFEALIAEIYAKKGEDARLTLRSGDHGADVVVFQENGKNRLVQCKHTKSGKPQSSNGIFEILQAQDHYKKQTSKTFEHLEVYTNAKAFGKSAQHSAKTQNVELKCYKDLEKDLNTWPICYEKMLLRGEVSKEILFKNAGLKFFNPKSQEPQVLSRFVPFLEFGERHFPRQAALSV